MWLHSNSNKPKTIMAPRKAAAKATSIDPKCLTLKLHIEKGPLFGQINEFHPGSLIRIGRVVRGNTLSIKEDGISSKHLIIQLDDEQQHWTISDLDSSNGTFLNGIPLTPHKPLLLSQNDQIKIGETTAICVTFEIVEIRKNTRGHGKNLGVIPEDKELGLKGNQTVVDNTEIGNDVSVVEHKVSTRRTRNSKKSDVEVPENVSVRVTRSLVKEKESVDLGVVEAKSKKRGGRGKTNVPAENTVAEEKDEELNIETGKEGECGGSGVEKNDTGTRKGRLLVDLETMTLGEWFDFLEVYLPKQIIDATEEVISDMKEKAKRLHEYKLQQMKAKK